MALSGFPVPPKKVKVRLGSAFQAPGVEAGNKLERYTNRGFENAWFGTGEISISVELWTS